MSSRWSMSAFHRLSTLLVSPGRRTAKPRMMISSQRTSRAGSVEGRAAVDGKVLVDGIGQRDQVGVSVTSI